METLEHALLYSIGVNLPAHRVGQLDRVLVLASPINDINLHAWDLNRVQKFLQLDIGVRVELCTKCLQNKLEKSITFIMEKMFIKDCIKFLCEEARIEDVPVEESGFIVYKVPHNCLYVTPPMDRALPPPYSENTPPPLMPKGLAEVDHIYDTAEFVERTSEYYNSASDSGPSNSAKARDLCPNKRPLNPVFHFPDEVWGDESSGSGPTSVQINPRPASTPGPIRTSSFTESLFLADGILTKTTTTTTRTFPDLPPRTIPRKNHETSIPATAHLSSNFQPHFFDNSAGKYSMDTPYQVSSRIIITDGGDVQYERNIMGNRPGKRNGGLRLMDSIPLPPRGNKIGTGMESQKDGAQTRESVALHTETDVEMHADPKVGISINTTLTSSTVPDSPPRNSPWQCDHTHSSSTSRPSALHTTVAESTHTGLQNENTGSSLVTTLFSTKMTPPIPSPSSTSPSGDFLRQKNHGIVLPSQLNRTTSESRSSPLSKDRAHKRQSFSTSTKNPSQSSLDGYEVEDDCYVIVKPPNLSQKSTSSSSILSPSYIRETQLFDGPDCSSTLVVAAQQLPNDVFEDNNDKRISLADAGDVIRQDWLASLNALRQEEWQEHSISKSQTARDMALNEVALFDHRRNLRTNILSHADYVDDSMFLPPPSLKHVTHNNISWRTDSSSSSSDDSGDDDSLNAKLKIKLPPKIASRARHASHLHASIDVQSADPVTELQHSVWELASEVNNGSKSGCVQRGASELGSRCGHRPRSTQVKKPTIRPRKKNKSTSALADARTAPREQFHSNTAPREQLRDHSLRRQVKSSSVLSKLCHSGSKEASVAYNKRQSDDHFDTHSDYVEDSIPIVKTNKPIPVPRTSNTIGVKSSVKASMVTMGINHFSSSEGDLLDAVLKDSLSPQGMSHWTRDEGGSLNHKFHSSTGINYA